MEFLTMKAASNGLAGNSLWLASHGGVSSEYFTKQLKIKYKNYYLPSGRQYKGIIVHYHKPVIRGPKKAIYIFGDLYNSIYSQIRRHPYNAAKLKNTPKYPNITSMGQFLRMKKKDPYNIEHQFTNFMVQPITYPLFIMKYNSSLSVIDELRTFVNKKFEYKFRQRSTNFVDKFNKRTVQRMKEIYSHLDWIMKQMPELLIRFPKNTQYTLVPADIIKTVELNKNQKMLFTRSNLKVYNNTINTLTIIHKDKTKTFDNCTAQTVVRYDKQYCIIYSNSETNRLCLYSTGTGETTELWIDNVKTKDNMISSKVTVAPYLYSKRIHLILNTTPLQVAKVINIKTGQCTIVKGNCVMPERSDFDAATELHMWNYPNYIGFIHKRDSEYSNSVIFNVKTHTFSKDKETKLAKEPTTIYDMKLKGAYVSVCANEEERQVEHTMNFQNFCRNFST